MSQPGWVADPAIAWRILVTAEVSEPPPPDVVRRRLAELYVAQDWPGEARVEVTGDLHSLRRSLGDERSGIVSVGISDRSLVVSAHHSRVDGLGLLAVLAAVAGTPVTSSARGVGDRPDGAGPFGTVVRRLAEVAASPPARIVQQPPSGPSQLDTLDTLDTYVERSLPGHVRTADLVVAGARGVRSYNRAQPGARRTRHVAVAVGVTRDATTHPIADRSALLRLRDVEQLDAASISDALRQAPTQHVVQAGNGGSALMRVGLRVLAPRLGSTLLVSHLGSLRAPGIETLAFHPVTAGGTGVSLGAATLAATTTTTRLTLRARGTDWTHDGLEQLLEAVVKELR